LKAAKKFLNSPYFFWALLALPSLPLIFTVLGGGEAGESAMAEALETAGTFSALMLIVTLALSPLLLIFSRSRVLKWLIQRRRYLGVAAFSYGMAHGVFYLVDVGSISEVLGSFTDLGILAGWLAMVIFLPMAITSNKVMLRAMGWKRWKLLQQGGYIAAVLVIIHWTMVEPEFGLGQILFGALGILELYRLIRHLADKRAASRTPSLAGA